MTRFEMDMLDVREGHGIEVLRERKLEIEKLTNEGKRCKNKFRQQCIAQELAKLEEEYDELAANV